MSAWTHARANESAIASVLEHVWTIYSDGSRLANLDDFSCNSAKWRKLSQSIDYERWAADIAHRVPIAT